MAYRGYKYRLYPDSEARAFFARCFGATRYCYNYCVREYDKATAEGRQLSGFDIAALMREHTKDLAWMANVDYEIKESAPRRFDNALGKFKRREANRPREHKKGDHPTMSYTTGGVIKVDFKHDLVQLPKIGLVKARLHRTFTGDIVSATIKREADGNYYISLTVSSDDPCIPQKPHTEAGTVGIDVGLRHLATLSDGTYIDLPDMQRIVARIQFLKNRLERQTEGSKRYYRTKLQIARLYHHQANITKDAHCKAAVKLCNDHDTICMETLNVAGMKRGQRCEKTSGDVVFNAELHRTALGLFIDRVKRKAADTGTNFVGIDRFEPSTKTCSHCGYVLPAIDLDTKEWTCPECGTHHDRDINAAVNIRNKGIEQLQASQPKARHKETLPLAEGNVKPAKKATAGCNLRTGKGKVNLDQPPKAQIADGTAPPRIFKEPHIVKEPCFDIPKELKYFKKSGLVKKAGVTINQFEKWKRQLLYGEIPEEMKTTHDRILTAIKQVSEELRQTKIREKDRLSTYKVLGMMNSMVRADWLIAEVMTVEPNYTIWRSRERTPNEIQTINRIVTRGFPDKLDAMVSKLKTFAYEQPELLEQTQYEENAGCRKLKGIYNYIKIYRITRMACVTTYAFHKWYIFRYKYGEKMFSYEDILRCLQSLKEFASILRSMEIIDDSKRGINRRLKEYEKDLWVASVLWDIGFYPKGVYDNIEKKERAYNIEAKDLAYNEWKSSDKTAEDIAKINQAICWELPEMIDRFVAEELPALKWEIQSRAR